jgi:UDP-N-acetylglucosamine enolpyruvyl transferase
MKDFEVRCPRFRGGTIEIGGFKHSLVSVVSACLAARGAVSVENAPDILEREVLTALLANLGCRVSLAGGRLDLDCRRIRGHAIDPVLSHRIHGSLYLVPALAAGWGRSSLASSGGCAIGDGREGQRPTEHLVRVMGAFGIAARTAPDGAIEVADARALPTCIDIMDFSESADVLTGPHISGATKAALICAAGVRSAGRSVVRHPYPKPDVLDCIRYLEEAGYACGHGSDEVSVARVRPEPLPVALSLTPDLSEIVTYITLSVLTGAPMTLRAPGIARALDGLAPEIALLRQMGIELEVGADRISLPPLAQLRSVDIEVTSVGIYSDHQPFFALLLTRGDRPATIREFVWKSRFGYAEALKAFGAKIETIDRGIRVHPSTLRTPSEPLAAHDLRMAGVLLVGALTVGGPVTLRNMHHLDRGYAGIEEHTARMGACYRTLGEGTRPVPMEKTGA